ncbi:MAG: hypothetical protein RLZZ338_238, partial [Cyanobacteriota bacterium]
ISMRYSLLSQFHGTLLGAVLGDCFARGDKLRDRGDGSVVKNEEIADKSVEKYPLEKSRVLFLSTESIITCRGFYRKHWRESINKVNREEISLSEGIWQILPIIIFYHENEIKLTEILQEIISDSEGEEKDNPNPISLGEGKIGLLGIGYTIAQLLKQPKELSNLIPQTIDYLNSDCLLVELLELVQNLIKQGASLENARHELGQKVKVSPAIVAREGKGINREKRLIHHIALGMYCFLSSPQDFRLAVTRAIPTRGEDSLMTTLTGIFGGSYNSSISIPVEWYSLLNSISHEEKIRELARNLYAIWSGRNDPQEQLSPHCLNVIPGIYRD